jgi:hypothetical protein
MLEDLDLSSIPDERIRHLVVRLLNLLETVTADLRAAHAEIQRLRDEINRLKGEQGQPRTQPNVPPASADHSSEQERRVPRDQVKRAKNATITIDREQVLTVDPARLPPDAEFKGYRAVIVQDVILRTDNVRFYKEKYYPPEHRGNLSGAPSRQATRGRLARGLRRWRWSSTTPAR